MNRLVASIEAYANYISNIVIQADELDYKLAQTYIPLFKSMDSLSSSIIVVIDYYRNDYFFVSKRFHALFGSHTSNFETKQQQWFRKRVHPEDYVVNIAHIKAQEYLKDLPLDQRKNFKLMHELRMLNDNNKWIRLLIQDSVLEYDKKGAVWLVMKVIDFAPNQDLESPGRSVLYNMNTNELVFSCIGQKMHLCKISPREKEVLILISQGLLSKHIADKLSISIYTVGNHRKSLLRKLKVHNSAEATKQAIKLKII